MKPFNDLTAMPIFERPPLETFAMARDRWTPIYIEHGRLIENYAGNAFSPTRGNGPKNSSFSPHARGSAGAAGPMPLGFQATKLSLSRSDKSWISPAFQLPG